LYGSTSVDVSSFFDLLDDDDDDDDEADFIFNADDEEELEDGLRALDDDVERLLLEAFSLSPPS
jgi:hypothetical protein